MKSRTVAENRKARHDYFIDETFEAGIQLVGTEVKALRAARANIADSYAAPQGEEIYLLNLHISEYGHGNRFNHELRRPRKLLLHRREIDKLLGLLKRGGATLVPLSIYFNERGIAKVSLGLARGKKQYDKRADMRDRDWQRAKQRMLKRSV
ncbi:SsrA-binding protein SmpB [Oceanibacterium hippocampi]|uniref:SsrA-binding protein n=1 Tax=Oceanibacterium hippocampi TaxID=745714 RepID=A0A1Y5TYL8_9PROT|nr:SsrA-binding protein SmpB [Oceanibacterium hippocampi]SLN77089.1 SsrA-binding protein [Oceanibacterium hippocampi]